jgi:16S rRNA G966 N2-methylase RsmD
MPIHTRVFKKDSARRIDRVIDYFGGHSALGREGISLGMGAITFVGVQPASQLVIRALRRSRTIRRRAAYLETP